MSGFGSADKIFGLQEGCHRCSNKHMPWLMPSLLVRCCASTLLQDVQVSQADLVCLRDGVASLDAFSGISTICGDSLCHTCTGKLNLVSCIELNSVLHRRLQSTKSQMPEAAPTTKPIATLGPSNQPTRTAIIMPTMAIVVY